jgi:Mlc titration factor MtfA (ptsG expression regulator)
MFNNMFARLGAQRTVTIPDDLWQHTCAALPFAGTRPADDLARLRTLVEQLLATKEMAATGGLELSADIQVNVALQACLPILNLGIDWYRGWTGIVIYPGEFLVPRATMDEAGVMHEFTEPISGEAWEGGPLLLSWSDARAGRAGTGPYNVVIHEFTHKIDMLGGEANGVPPFDRKLHPRLTPKRWSAAMQDAHARFDAELELIESRLPSGLEPEDEAADPFYAHLPLDPYAAHSEAEFFAVSSEAFFVAPQRLKAALPEWYAQLAAFYLQDPAAQSAGNDA